MFTNHIYLIYIVMSGDKDESGLLPLHSISCHTFDKKKSFFKESNVNVENLLLQIHDIHTYVWQNIN